MRFWTKSLVARLVTYFLLLSLITVSLVGIFAFVQARNMLQSSVFDRLDAVATLQESEINRWVTERRQDVVLISRLSEIREPAEQILTNQETAGEAGEALITFFDNVLNEKPDFQEFFILTDPGGRVVLSSDRSHRDDYHVLDSYFVRGQSETYVQNVYTSPESGQPTMTISTPLLDPTGQRRLGVLVAHLNLDKMDEIASSQTGLGQTGETYLVDRVNVFVSAERFGRQEFPRGVHTEGIDAAVQGLDGAGLYLNYENEPVIGVYRWLDDQEIALLAEMHQAEAFAPARQLAYVIFTLGLLASGILAAGMYLAARQIARPILAVTETAAKVAGGDLSQSAPVMTEDELGILANAFNQMTAELRNLYGDLENEVAIRTAELARRIEQLNLINQVGRRAAITLNLDELLPTIVNLIRDSFDYYAAAIFLLDKEKNDAYIAAAETDEELALTGNVRLRLDTPGIVVTAAKSGRALVVNDVSREPRFRFEKSLPKTQSELALPLRVGNETLGVLDLQSQHRHRFSEQDVQVLQTLADQLAVVIFNARLFQSEATSRRAAETLREVGQVVSSTLDLGDVLERILLSLREMLAYDSATIMLLEQDRLRIQATRGFQSSNAVQDFLLPLDEHPLNWEVIAGERPLLFSDVSQDARWRGDRVPGSAPVRAWIGAPLIAAGQTIGMLTIDSHEAGRYTDQHLPLVSAFATQAAIALRNADLFQAAEEARREAETANELKSQFLANMSHELRTPLNSIINFAYLLNLGTEGPLTAGQEDLIQRIEDAGQHLLGLINDILDLAKIESGRLELNFDEVELYEVLHGVSSTTSGLLREKPIRLKQEIPDNLPRIWADRTRVRQVLLNLLSNAVKFTEEGEITIEAWSDESWVTLSVTDTGQGMKPGDVEKAFAEFVQIDGHLTRRVGGTGLGLPISKRFVEMHGGRMWAESEWGVGSTFYFTLPTAPSSRQEADNASPLEARVLIIDDDPKSRETIARQLEHGYQVVKLSDSRQAVERARADRPDVIVLDVIMPHRDGWEVLEALKANTETRDIPVVICTIVQEEQLATSLGANDYLVKPVNHQEVRRIVEQFAPPGGKVLAVDDDPDALEIIRRTLGGTSYQVTTASDGWEGLAAVKKQLPDVIVLDLMMPGLSGFEVLATLRADPRTANLPVVVATAKDLTIEERAQLQAEAATLLQKGQFSPEELVNVIRHSVARKP